MMRVTDCWLLTCFFLNEPNLGHSENIPIENTFSNDWESARGESQGGYFHFVSWYGCWPDGCVLSVKFREWHTSDLSASYDENLGITHIPLLPCRHETVPARGIQAEVSFRENLLKGVDSGAGTFCFLPACPPPPPHSPPRWILGVMPEGAAAVLGAWGGGPWARMP